MTPSSPWAWATACSTVSSETETLPPPMTSTGFPFSSRVTVKTGTMEIREAIFPSPSSGASRRPEAPNSKRSGPSSDQRRAARMAVRL